MDKVGKQSRENSQKEPSQTSLRASQTGVSSTRCSFYKCCFPSPKPGVGARRDRRLLFEDVWALLRKPKPTLRNAAVPALSGAAAERDLGPSTCRMRAPSPRTGGCPRAPSRASRTGLCPSPPVLETIYFTGATQVKAGEFAEVLKHQV